MSPTPLPEERARVVQRTLLRPEQELDVQPLYLDSVSTFGEAGRSVDIAPEGEDAPRPGAAESGPDTSTGSAGGGLAGVGRVTPEGHAQAYPGRRITFGTYFNAFPASYWRRWTDVSSVRLQVRLRGEGTFLVYRSTSKGHVLRADSVTVDGEAAVSHEFELSLKPFIDGGWYWFDIEAGEKALTLELAQWCVETERVSPGTLSIGITTFNRPDFCVDQLVSLAADAEVHELLDEVLVVDQGTQRVAEDPGYAEAARALGSRLRLIEQANLGGSGGFSRAMHETAAKGSSNYVLLLDDDVVCELEGIRRAVAFADLAKSPTIVGGQMFNLYDRSVLHAFGETLGRYRWNWGPAPNTLRSHDFAKKALRSTPWLHRRIDADYNGWWMCLIPTEVVRNLGLSFPAFIKWDDAEYGLRAQRAGYPTVTMPGVAVWHMPWTEKDDTVDWQAYFHERNRLVSALLHSPYPRGGRMVRESLEAHAKHAASMQYAPAEMILMAISDVLAGPERLHRDMVRRPAELRELRRHYADSQSEPMLDAFPAPWRKKPPRKGRAVVAPSGPWGRARTATRGLLRQVRPVRPLSREHPETAIPHVDQKWWRFMQFDSALVSSADGTTASWYRRDRTEFRRQVERSTRLHAQLYAEWPRLARLYREALAEVTSPEAWKPTFEGRTED